MKRPLSYLSPLVAYFSQPFAVCRDNRDQQSLSFLLLQSLFGELVNHFHLKAQPRTHLLKRFPPSMCKICLFLPVTIHSSVHFPTGFSRCHRTSSPITMEAFTTEGTCLPRAVLISSCETIRTISCLAI